MNLVCERASDSKGEWGWDVMAIASPKKEHLRAEVGDEDEGE